MPHLANQVGSERKKFMVPEAPLRILIFARCLVVQSFWIFRQREFGKFDRAFFTFAAAYLSYYALKDIFGF